MKIDTKEIRTWATTACIPPNPMQVILNLCDHIDELEKKLREFDVINLCPKCVGIGRYYVQVDIDVSFEIVCPTCLGRRITG